MPKSAFYENWILTHTIKMIGIIIIIFNTMKSGCSYCVLFKTALYSQPLTGICSTA